MPQDRSCWKCSWNRLGGITAIGVCWWWVKKLGFAKEIPAHVCDKGCKLWTDEDIDFKEVEKFLKKTEKEDKAQP